jgi:hypothetical protein
MESGIIVRNTPSHVEKKLLAKCAFAFVEADAYARHCHGTPGKPEFFPMISGFLGAKTWAVKKSEAGYARSAGARRILYFPDLRNIKYGDLDAFRNEITSLDFETKGIEVIYYVAVDCLTPGELEESLAEIKGNRFKVMLGFGGCDGLRTTPAVDVVAATLREIAVDRLWCAFWEAEELDESAPALEEFGIQGVAALV